MSGFLRDLYALFGDIGKMIDHFLVLALLLRAVGIVERLTGVLQLQRREARSVGIALCSTVAAARVRYLYCSWPSRPHPICRAPISVLPGRLRWRRRWSHPLLRPG